MNSTTPKQSRQECLSEAFVHAIASFAGLTVQWRSRDYGIDGSFKKVLHHGERFIESGVPLDFQLKSTTNWEVSDGFIIYDMEAKTYNDFIYWQANTSSPVRLILLCLPSDEVQWVTTEPDQLVLRNCCYFCSVSGDPTENSQTKRIRIPNSNILTPETLSALIESIQGGVEI